MANLFWFDVETTGKEIGHEIHELSYIVEIDEQVKDQGTFKVRPLALDPENVESGLVRPIDDDALAISGVSIVDLADESRITPQQLYKALSTLLGVYVDKYMKNKTDKDKFIFAGQNVQFDQRFLKDLWSLNGDSYFGSWFAWKPLDLLDIVRIWEVFEPVNLPNRQLTTLAAYYHIDLQAHSSQEDITVTREVAYLMLEDISAHFIGKNK